MRVLTLLPVLLIARSASAQTCTEPHYRWTEKTSESQASIAPVKRSIGTILSWATLEFTREGRYKCAPRKGHELQTYSVVGWVRRVKTHETDGDWHVELTDRQDSDTGSCIVAEIPPPGLGANYAQAPPDLPRFGNWDSHADRTPPGRRRLL